MLHIDTSGIEIPNYLEIKERLQIFAAMVKRCKIESEEVEIHSSETIEMYKRDLTNYTEKYNNLIESLKIKL